MRVLASLDTSERVEEGLRRVHRIGRLPRLDVVTTIKRVRPGVVSMATRTAHPAALTS
jgi:hypothetical protein